MEENQEGVMIETPDSNEGIELPDTNLEETVEQQEENNESNVSKSEDNVDKSTEIYNKERKLRKEVEKRNRELEARIKALEEANKVPEKSTFDELVESGIDEDIAKSIAKAVDKGNLNVKKAEEATKNLQYQLELEKMSKQAGFEDILDYDDKIKELVDKGLTIEQSYYALTGGTSKREATRKIEAKLENTQARKEILGGLNKQGTPAVAKKQPIKATAEEIAVAKAAGISIEDYEAIKNMDNFKDYTNYKESKK